MTLIVSVMIIVIISFINPSAKERVFDQTLSQINLINKNKNNNDKIYIFSEQHNSHYVTAYKMFLDNKILGVGVKNFRNFCNHEKYSQNELSCSTHPHNTYIQLLSETGIVGFLFLMFTLFYFCKYLLKHLLAKLKGRNYYTDFEICILSGVAIFLWPFIPTGNIFNNWLNIITILSIPFLIWSKNQKI